jgi:hypothetical protein
VTEKEDIAMTDRRRTTDQPPNLSGMDYVLEGASVRDRFLTAFLLQHHETLISDWPQVAELPDDSPPTGMSVLFPGPEEEGASIQAERPCELLTIRVVGDWFGADDDDM